MFRHILIPLDFTKKNTAAINVAVELAKQNDSRVTLLHVIETIEYAEEGEFESFYKMLQERAQKQLTAFASRFAETDIPVDQEIVMGKTASGILNFAAQEAVDLVVLSSHKVRVDEAPKGWATLSYQVSILCQCPVLLVK